MTIPGGLLLSGIFILAGCATQKQFIPIELKSRITEVPNWQNLKLNGWRIGPKDAPVRIVEFFDYQCRYCKKVLPAIKTIRRKYTRKVIVVLENYPSDLNQYAFGASMAAECVRRYNPGKFMAFHDSLFKFQKQLGQFSYTGLAVRVGISDTTAIHQCIESKETVPIIKTSSNLAQKLNIPGTPTFIINNMMVRGILSLQEMEALVQKALK